MRRITSLCYAAGLHQFASPAAGLEPQVLRPAGQPVLPIAEPALEGRRDQRAYTLSRLNTLTRMNCHELPTPTGGWLLSRSARTRPCWSILLLVIVAVARPTIVRLEIKE